MAEEKPKVKIKDRIKFIKKQVVFLPILLCLPVFLLHPSEKLIVMLLILVVWHFICFMSPVYMIKYLIEKIGFNQKFTDFLSNSSAILMWVFTIFDWLRLLFWGNLNWEFPAGLFLVPFLSFIKVGSVILFLTLLYKIYIFCKQNDKDE